MANWFTVKLSSFDKRFNRYPQAILKPSRSKQTAKVIDWRKWLANDAFVMFQWGKSQNAKNVFLLPDGNGDFTRQMGMLVKKENLGFGMRSWRYAMHVENGEIKQLFTEPGYQDDAPSDPFEVSDADTMLNYLKNR
ncbi:redoxin family protein [Marinomonas sp. THO17]|uniref:redoxin family protein n=1 Tax=Marinomonas sp. THO17 TaxID=3149048 RepID=UPI00336BF5AC